MEAPDAFPTVTIGFVARERFSMAPRALRRIFETTDVPFRLVIVNCAIPPRFWRQIEAEIAGRDNVEVIQRDSYVRPNLARRLVLDASTSEFTCLIENDVLVEDGWLRRLVDDCIEHEAELAAPLVWEGKPGKLPHRTRSASYDLEYGTATLHVHEDALGPGDRVLLIDDVIATGGTALASCQLLENLGAEVAGCGFLVELAFLKGRDRLADYRVHSVLQY